MLEDKLLIFRLKRGDEQALRQIYEKYKDTLLTVATSLLRDTNEAEDVLHDVFVSFAESAASFRLRGNLRSYLAACVINRARDRLRANKRRPVRLEDAEQLSSGMQNPQQKVLCSEEVLRLNRAVSELPYEQREAVILHVKGGMKFRQIAKVQGVSVSTVQGRYRYGLNKLRSILDGQVQK